MQRFPCQQEAPLLSPVRLDMDHGGSIPAEAKIEGLRIPTEFKSRFCELKNVEVTSNGAVVVRPTKETAWEYIGRPVYQQDEDGIAEL
jgi:hypothetical protein